MQFVNAVSVLSQAMTSYLRRTPLLHSNYYSRKLGAEIYFKLENIQVTGSFKARGALAKALSLPEDERKKGFIAASAGNHGLGVCAAAERLGTKAKIFMPKATPDFKVRKIVEWGGEPVLVGDDWAASNVAAQEDAQQSGMVYFHPFDDEEVMRGQATIAHEVLADLPDADMIVCSIGGGGLISGIARYAKEFNPKIQVQGIETRGADSMALSFKKGELSALDEVNTVAESIAVRQVGAAQYEYARALVDGVHVVDDEEALSSQIDILQQIKMLVEPASSCSLTALEKGLVPNIQGKKIVVILCGGNYPIEKLARTIQADAGTIFKTTKDTLHRQLQQFGLSVTMQSPQFEKFYKEIKRRETDGYAYAEAEASLELFALQFFGKAGDTFDLSSFRILEERKIINGVAHNVSEAKVALTLQGSTETAFAESEAGPVSALDKALKQILLPRYPALNDVHLTDYRVRILTPHDGTAAVTRVMIESKDNQGNIWNTLGVSADVIGASYHALQDSYLYKLLKKIDK